MNNPFDIPQSIRLFLNFKNQNSFGLIEITEPEGFDASSFTITQDTDRYGRDVEYSNKETMLTFTDYKGRPTNNPITLMDGTVIDRLTMGLEFLLETDRITGTESVVEFIVELNGTTFSVGQIDFLERETDGRNFFKAQVIQSNEKATLKKRLEVNVDLFSTEDLDGNTVEPLETVNMLLKAKPVRQISFWRNDKEYYFQDSDIPINFQTYFNAGTILEQYGIENSYAVFSPDIKTDAENMDLEDNFKAIIPTTNLTNVNTSLDVDIDFEMTQGVLNGAGRIYLGFSISDNTGVVEYASQLYSKTWGPSEPDFNLTINQEFTEAIDVIAAGKILTFFGLIFGNADCTVKAHVKKWELKIEATSTAVSSVIKTAREIDVIKAAAQRVGGYNVIAPRFDVGGEFYNQYISSGYMLRQGLDKPFNYEMKDIFDDLKELNCDYQVLPNKNIFIGLYDDFYPNKYLGHFNQKPNSEFLLEYNKRYMFQTFEYKYQKYEQSKDERNTIDAVHTEAQFMLPTSVEGQKVIEVDKVRDPFMIETVRRENFISTNTEKTSLSSDDNKFIFDGVELQGEYPSNEIKNVFTAQISLDPDTIKILAPENVSWNLLGFNQGEPMYFVGFRIDGVNYGYSGTLTATEITRSMLTLTNNTSFPFPSSIAGTYDSLYITIEYPLTDVDITIRTNEGFSLISGIEEPDSFANLKYTIRRNMRYWENFIKTSSNYVQDKIFKNTYWKSNGELITQLDSEIEPIKENESVQVSDLRERILEPIIIKTTVIADFDKVLSLIEAMNTINEDNTLGGFISVIDMNNRVNNGYVKTLKYNWTTNELELEIEKKFESDVLSISRETNKAIYYINHSGYDSGILGGGINFFNSGDYVRILDLNGIPLTNPERFDKIIVNGQKYNSAFEVCKAISQL